MAVLWRAGVVPDEALTTLKPLKPQTEFEEENHIFILEYLLLKRQEESSPISLPLESLADRCKPYPPSGHSSNAKPSSESEMINNFPFWIPKAFYMKLSQDILLLF